MLYWMTRGFGGAGGERDPAPSAIVPERRYITVRGKGRESRVASRKRQREARRDKARGIGAKGVRAQCRIGSNLDS